MDYRYISWLQRNPDRPYPDPEDATAAGEIADARHPDKLQKEDSERIRRLIRAELALIIPNEFHSLAGQAVGAKRFDNFVRVATGVAGGGCYIGPSDTVDFPWKFSVSDEGAGILTHLDAAGNGLPLIDLRGLHKTYADFVAPGAWPTDGEVSVSGSGVTWVYCKVSLITPQAIEVHVDSTLPPGTATIEYPPIVLIEHTSGKITGFFQCQFGTIRMPANA